MAEASRFTDVEYGPRFTKTFSSLPESVRKQVKKAAGQLYEDPRYPGLQAHPIKPLKTFWEAYVNRSDRLIYRWEGDTLYIVDLVAHDDIGKYG